MHSTNALIVWITKSTLNILPHGVRIKSVFVVLSNQWKREKEMAFGLGNTRGGNNRGTLNPTNIGRVYVEYKDSGARVWETPSVARNAIANGQANEIKPEQPKP